MFVAVAVVCSVARSHGLIPRCDYNETGQLADVEFITYKHLLGSIGTVSRNTVI